MLSLIIGIIGTVLGIVLLVLSIYGRKKYTSKKTRCTASVDGTLIRFAKKEYMRDTPNSDAPRYFDIYYYPIYEYFVNGQRYEVQGSYGKEIADETLLGTKRQIVYNPDNCSECYVSGEDIKTSYTLIKILGSILIILGVVNLIAFIILKIFLPNAPSFF